MKSEKGNALVILLIAIAMMAALSLAIMSSSTGKNDIDDEEVALAASQIMQYVSLLKADVKQLMMVKGCTSDNLDWRNNQWKRIDGAPSVGILHTPVDAKEGCAIFSDYGGPVKSDVFFDKYAEPTYNDVSPTWRVKAGHAIPAWVNRQGTGTPANDIAIIFRGMHHDVCAYLLDPETKPTGVIEQYMSSPDPNDLPGTTWSDTNDIIDQPENLAGRFFAEFNSLATGPACDVGTIIVAF